MYKIICLIGKSGSGKDTIIQKLRADLKIPIAISFTSRPMRTGEIQDLTYHFVSDSYFEDNKEKFIEQRLYKVINKDGTKGIWRPWIRCSICCSIRRSNYNNHVLCNH